MVVFDTVSTVAQCGHKEACTIAHETPEWGNTKFIKNALTSTEYLLAADKEC